MAFYRRHLPHWQPDGARLFVTWRLYGSLPEKLIRSIRNWGEIQKGPRHPNAGKLFRELDKQLDAGQTGPDWLRQPRIAKLVAESLVFAAESVGLYDLHAFVVMSNHVHVLLTPKAPLNRITRRVKGFTALRANAILRRRGRPFWQDESFDRWIRSDSEFQRVKSYIERNPVLAGLVDAPEKWPWSSASKRP